MDFLKKPHLNKVSFHCIFILTVYVILVIIRLPILINADFFLGADESFMANDMVDLLQGGQFSFYNENVSYEGTVNGWITVLFFWLFGVNSLVFKLPAVLFYTLYIWSFFLMVMRSNKKVAWVSVALLVLCPPQILFLTTLNYAVFLAAFIGNVAFLIFFSNRDNPSSVKVFYINFLLGFSLYIFTYSIIYMGVLIILWVIDAKISFRNIFEWFKPASFRVACARFADIIILLNFFWVFLTYATGGISSKIGGFYFFNSFMRSNAPHYWMFDPSKISIPFIEFFILIVIFRVIIYRTDIIYLLKTARNSGSIQLFGIGLSGFIIGLTPRWIGLYKNSISGHPGYELDFGLPQMWHKLSDLFSVQLPRILELNSYLGMLVTILVGVAIFNFLRRNKGGVEMIFAILPIVLLSALIIYQKPNVVRHIFPLYAVVVFYVATLLSHVEKKSSQSFWTLLVFLGIYYGHTTYSYYEDKNIINRFQIIKKDSIQNDLIQHAREKEFKVVYTDYSAHKLQFLSGGSPNFVEFYSNPYTGWKRLAKVRDYINFAVFVPEGKNQMIYETHLKNNKISCNKEKIKKYLVLSKCKTPTRSFRDLRALNQLRRLAPRLSGT